MDHLWTWSGKYFGCREGNDLWTYRGLHVGRFEGDDVYGTDGRYLGELMDESRLITNITKRSSYCSTLAPHEMRAGYAPHPGRPGYTPYAGYQDFPAPNSFD
jgi:hypothetical protein